MALEACCGPAAALLHGGPADPVALGEDAYALLCGSARDVGLDQGAPVVSRGPLPAHAAALGDEPQMPAPPASARFRPCRSAPRSSAAGR